MKFWVAPCYQSWDIRFQVVKFPVGEYISLVLAILLRICFFLSGFSFTDTDVSQDSRGREGTIFFFHSTTSNFSRTFTHLFITLPVRWLSHIFNRTACIYQTATWWDLPSYWITICLIDDVNLVFVCLLRDLILGFCDRNLDSWNRWTRTRIDYRPCITNEPTNQVCLSP